MLNAILIRDFRIYSRNKTYLNIFILYVFILCAIVFGMLWFVNISKKTLNSEYGTSISFILFIFISSAIYSICPALAVNIVSSEKNDFYLIKPTFLRNYQIITSKVIFVITHVLIFILLSFPIMILVISIAGFSLKILFYCYLVTFISALAFCIMGILWSSVFGKMIALSLTCISVGIFSIGTILTPLTITKIIKAKLSADIINILYGLSPFWILSRKISESNLPDKIFTIPLWFYPIFVYFLISVITISLTFVFVRKW
ncbi:MAG: hypothetical protein ACPL7B_01860 [Candidatus Poribacteria bacterium]